MEDPRDKDDYHLYRPEEDEGKELYHITHIVDDNGHLRDVVVRPVDDATTVWPEGYYVRNDEDGDATTN